jgi:hypothetical protein
METNGILYDIDTTNTFKYEGSTVENPALTILDLQKRVHSIRSRKW